MGVYWIKLLFKHGQRTRTLVAQTKKNLRIDSHRSLLHLHANMNNAATLKYVEIMYSLRSWMIIFLPYPSSGAFETTILAYLPTLLMFVNYELLVKTYHYICSGT